MNGKPCPLHEQHSKRPCKQAMHRPPRPLPRLPAEPQQVRPHPASATASPSSTHRSPRAHAISCSLARADPRRRRRRPRRRCGIRDGATSVRARGVLIPSLIPLTCACCRISMRMGPGHLPRGSAAVERAAARAPGGAALLHAISCVLWRHGGRWRAGARDGVVARGRPAEESVR
jgi:hypothetical protein